MGSLIIILIVVTVYCSETYCEILPTAPSEDVVFVERNDSRAFDKGSPGEIFWKNLVSLSHKPMKMEESQTLANNTSIDSGNRKSRLLGSLAFLAGLGFGGLATAASSTAKTIAKLPHASFTLNLGSSNKTPYFTAYYNPYPLIPYPLFYPGSLGLMPSVDLTKSQVMSHNDLTPQVISVYENKQPIELMESNEEYVNDEKKTNDDKSANNAEDRADHRPELRTQIDRNAEEKMIIYRCKEAQRKYDNSFKELAKEHEDLQIEADDFQTVLDLQAANRAAADANQNTTENTTRPITTQKPTRKPTHKTTHKPINNHTVYPIFPGYGGYPQDISHVDFTTDSSAHQYYGHSQINYNLPYEQPVNFYHDNQYNGYLRPPINPYISGPFQSDQINEYIGTDFNRVYPPEYQPPYSTEFRPVK